MSDIVERLREMVEKYDEVGWHADALEAADEIKRLREDIHWAVNVLLEKIAVRFEENDTWDVWRSDAAATVRSFKHEGKHDIDKSSLIIANDALGQRINELEGEIERLRGEVRNIFLDRAAHQQEIERLRAALASKLEHMRNEANAENRRLRKEIEFLKSTEITGEQN